MSIERGILLFQQQRFDMAETELRQALAADPDDAYAHSLLALCLMERKQLEDASCEARQAIHLAPDNSFAHYALAKVLYEDDLYDAAQTAIDEAIRLDPQDADYRFLLGAIHFDLRRFEDALRAADEGLAADPEHEGCTNLRVMALVKRGRTREAVDVTESALARNPESSATHANRGWTLLEQSKAEEALGHFRESLRLEPDNEWARSGIVEALKARNAIYAVMLRYFLWMSKLSTRAQWGVILGGYFANRFLTAAAENDQALAPWLLPLRVLYVIFVVLTWTAVPLFNLLLRLNRFGRLALSREEIVDSNWVGALIFLALLSLGACIAWGFEGTQLVAAEVFGFLIIPLAGTLKLPEKSRRPMWIYTGVMATLGLARLASLAGSADPGSGGWMMGLFFLGAIGAPWVANAMMMRGPGR